MKVDVQFSNFTHNLKQYSTGTAAALSLQKKVENNTLDLEDLLSSNDECSITSTVLVSWAGQSSCCCRIFSAYLVAVSWNLHINPKEFSPILSFVDGIWYPRHTWIITISNGLFFIRR